MASFPKALFISHGGGPLPLLDDPGHAGMVSLLRRLAASLPRPDAILVVSAHWEAPVPTITAGSQPPLIYDYYGFPAEAYSIRYPCAGEPALANEVSRRLIAAGLEARLDNTRGFDHGLFVPLKVMYPDASIPCVQLSLTSDLDAAGHIALGEALSGLAARNVLVLGSGFTFHNLRSFFDTGNTQARESNEAFETWLRALCASTAIAEPERRDRLVGWDRAPGARFCHPRAEHLLPLHVCYGAAQGPSAEVYDLDIAGWRSSMYLW